MIVRSWVIVITVGRYKYKDVPDSYKEMVKDELIKAGKEEYIIIDKQ